MREQKRKKKCKFDKNMHKNTLNHRHPPPLFTSVQEASWALGDGDPKLGMKRMTLGLLGLAFLTANHDEFEVPSGSAHLCKHPEDWLGAKVADALAPMRGLVCYQPTPTAAGSLRVTLRSPVADNPPLGQRSPRRTKDATTKSLKAAQRKSPGKVVQVTPDAPHAEDGWFETHRGSGWTIGTDKADKVSIEAGRCYYHSITVKPAGSRAKGKRLVLPRRSFFLPLLPARTSSSWLHCPRL